MEYWQQLFAEIVIHYGTYLKKSVETRIFLFVYSNQFILHYLKDNEKVIGF